GAICAGISGSECVSLSDDRNHCGACGNACAPNNICMGGQCVPDCGVLTACDGACVDVETDVAHCGTCGTACSNGKSCVQGTCSCSNGLQACGDACIDIASDPEHCGACDRACVAGGACKDGLCRGPDGCTDTPASNLALSGVDVYQTVQI